MITVTTKDFHRRYEPTIDFRKGKLVAELRNELPWRIVEITPDKLEFEKCAIEHKDGLSTARTAAGEVYNLPNSRFAAKTHLVMSSATISCQPEEEAVYKELAAMGLLSEGFMAELKKNGKAIYGVRYPWDAATTVEKFKDFFMTNCFYH